MYLSSDVGKGSAMEAELVPTGQASFLLYRFNLRLDFVRDAAGKVTGVTGYGDDEFEGKKLE